MEKKITVEQVIAGMTEQGMVSKLNDVSMKRLTRLLEKEDVQAALAKKTLKPHNLIIFVPDEKKKEEIAKFHSEEDKSSVDRELEVVYVLGTHFIPIISPKTICQFQEAALSTPKEFMRFAGAIRRSEEWRTIDARHITRETFYLEQLFTSLTNLRKHPAGKFLIYEGYDLIEEMRDAAPSAKDNILVAAKKYFSDYYLKKTGQPIKYVTDREKENGIQKGLIVVYAYSGIDSQETPVTYYIKTHSGGSLNSDQSLPPKSQEIDPAELFVYKFLELVGFGPKSHFFFDELGAGELFIATQDLQFTKYQKKDKKEKKFTIFSKTVAEMWHQLPDCAEKKAAEKEVIFLGVLSKVLMLVDVLTNGNNFGYVEVAKARKWKIFDFRIPGKGGNARIVEEFYRGNTHNLLSYNEPKGFLQNTFRPPTEEMKEHIARVSEVIGILEKGRKCTCSAGNKLPFNEAATTALDFATVFIKSNPKGFLHQEYLIKDLKYYVENVMRNFSCMANSKHLL